MIDIITSGDKVSECWRHIKKHYEVRLAMLRAKNDGNLTPEATQKIRGQIAEAKHILSLGADKPTPAPEDTDC